MEIEDFVSTNTTTLFRQLDIPTEFLDYDTETWEIHDNCKRADSSAHNSGQ